MADMLSAVIDSEKAILGSAILDRAALEYAIETLKPDEFVSPAHREIYAAMLDIHENGQPLDLVTLRTALVKRGTLETIGGISKLVDVAKFTPTAANIKAYVKIAHDAYTMRQLESALISSLTELNRPELDATAALEGTEARLQDIVTRNTTSNLTHIKHILPDAHERIERACLLKGKPDGVPTGMAALDSMTTGFHAGELIIIGARPGMGKTSFAMNVVENAAISAGLTCAVFSMEMPKEQLAVRLMCSAGLVNMQHVRKGETTDDEWLRLTTSLGVIGRAEIYIDDTAGLTPMQLLGRARRLKTQTQKLDLIVVDYLQLMNSGVRRIENRQAEVSAISRGLKRDAIQLGVPIVACAQLSRANVARSDKTPQLSDLRESGSIEQDADVVMFIHRPEYYEPTEDNKGLARLIIAKQRNGELGAIDLKWDGRTTRFTAA